MKLLKLKFLSAMFLLLGSCAGIQKKSGHQIAVNVSSVTWANVDASPDGQTIAFDMLGDIYLLSAKGGAAIPIIFGTAWETAPVISPDGSKIAYISDRSGAKNIWVSNLDGVSARQISFETERLPSNIAWAPDSGSLIARKHFTGARTVGAGEIWRYYLDEAVKPEALVSRHASQTDINDPIFAPDGDAIYYSEEVWPGDAFAYNKDPAKGIYAIKQLSLETGEGKVLVKESGGAVRPVASANGRYLAYITRRDNASALMVRDLLSGDSRIVYEGLDRDLQEVWATQGLYPSFTWLTGDQDILIWANGQISKINVTSGVKTDIPFSVSITKTVSALTVPTPYGVDRPFKVKAVRQLSVSPDGRRLAFQALGRIYVQDLPVGEVQRLTDGDERVEFYPSFSPDSAWIAYTTNSDLTLSDIRRTNINTGETRIISPPKGLLSAPQISPDQKWIIYNRNTDAMLFSLSDAQGAPGVYAVSWDGGEEKLITDEGRDGFFCRASDRVFYTRDKLQDGLPPDAWRQNEQFLVSKPVDGGAERIHARGLFVTQFRLSPDCRRLAWLKRWDVRLTPIDLTGEVVELDSAASIKASGDGGRNLGWTDDKRLHWNLGPVHYAAAQDSLSDISESSLTFSNAPAPSPDGFTLVGAKLVTMAGGEVIHGGVLVVRNGKIAAIGVQGDLVPPDDLPVIDAHGKTIVPGFIDVHWHGPYADNGVTPISPWAMSAGLSAGITTIFDPFADTESVFAVSEMQKSGLVLGPRLYSTGAALYGAMNEQTAVVNSYENAVTEIRRRKAYGATGVKLYLQQSRQAQIWLLEAARHEKMMVVSEQEMASNEIALHITEGLRSIEHNPPFQNIYDDLIAFWSGSGTASTPTLTVALGSHWGANIWLRNVFNDERYQNVLQFLPTAFVQALSQEAKTLPADPAPIADFAANAKALHDAGVRILVGAHGHLPGLGYHWEMWMLKTGGFSNLEILHAATIDAARHLGVDSDVGSLEAGKVADFIILGRDPLEDIENTISVEQVSLSGRLIDARTMQPSTP